jgi:hypothetical protein
MLTSPLTLSQGVYTSILLSRYNGNLTQVEICNQYLCRAHYAVGLLVSEQSKTLKVRNIEIQIVCTPTQCYLCRDEGDLIMNVDSIHSIGIQLAFIVYMRHLM